MDWQLIAIIAISLGSLAAFFAMGETPKPKQQNARNDQASTAPLLRSSAKDENTRRFLEDLKSQA